MHALVGPSLRRAVSLLASALLWLATAADRASSGELVFETDNDFLTSNQRDDLYTFSVALSWDMDEAVLRLRENAFTEREAGLRFDETFLTVGRELEARAAWTASVEAGVARIGRGLFGDGAQNAVHRLIGSPEVHLDYVDGPRYHPYGRIELTRAVAGSALRGGPLVEVEAAIDHKSSALLAWTAAWSGDAPVAVKATVGHRWVDADFAPLTPHVANSEPYVAVELALEPGLLVSWSYNAYGTASEHVAIGYRVDGRLGPRVGHR